LTGLGGSGKSTLAKKLCWDSQIKGNKQLTNLFVFLLNYSVWIDLF
jgi:GTPase SAR1 family protein